MSYLNKLYPHQLKIFYQIRNEFIKGNKRVMLRGATGIGKSILASCIVYSAYDKQKRVLLVAPRITLIVQLRQELIEIGILKDAIGVIQAPNGAGKYAFHPQRPIQIATVQSLTANWERWRKEGVQMNFDFVIIDEAHMNISTYKVLWDLYPKAFYLGMTGTPAGYNYSTLYDTLVCATEEAELIAKGYLPYFRYLNYEKPDIGDIKIKKGEDDYNHNQLKEIDQRVNTAQFRGDLVRTWVDEVLNKFGRIPTIVFANRIETAHEIAATYNAANITGVAAATIDSKMTDKEVRSHLKKFISGECTHLVSVEKVSTGFDLSLYCRLFDLPKISVGCVQLVRNSVDIKLIKQMWGRARGIKLTQGITIEWEGKQKYLPMGSKFAIYLDHAGVCQAFGDDKLLPNSPIEWNLEGKPKKKGKTTKTCPEGDGGCGCEVPKNAKVCPFCGFIFPDKPEPEEAPLEIDSTVKLTEVKMTAETRFQGILNLSTTPSWAFEQFVKFSPDWEECFVAAKQVGYKTGAAFYRWVQGQKIKHQNDDWIPTLEELTEILKSLKEKKEAPLTTYQAWCNVCREVKPDWLPTLQELSAIAQACGYKQGWAYREISNFGAQIKQEATPELEEVFF